MTFTPDTPTSLESRGNPYEMLQLCGSLESVTPTDLATAFSYAFPPLEVFLAEGLKPSYQSQSLEPAVSKATNETTPVQKTDTLTPTDV